ncbi:unnamed protein product [Amoebophrya sp. A120]|nr:unnamed protein product [Amoebophrya sp. A120]|eukprot:GSA120T00008728001.1
MDKLAEDDNDPFAAFAFQEEENDEDAKPPAAEQNVAKKHAKKRKVDSNHASPAASFIPVAKSKMQKLPAARRETSRASGATGQATSTSSSTAKTKPASKANTVSTSATTTSHARPTSSAASSSSYSGTTSTRKLTGRGRPDVTVNTPAQQPLHQQPFVNTKQRQNGFRERWRSVCAEHFRDSQPCDCFPELPLRLLFLGLNPSEGSWESGVSYGHPSNLFWKIVVEAKLVPLTLEEKQEVDADFCTTLARIQNRLPSNENFRIGWSDLGCREAGSDAIEFSALLLQDTWYPDFCRRGKAHVNRVRSAENMSRFFSFMRPANNRGAVTSSSSTGGEQEQPERGQEHQQQGRNGLNSSKISGKPSSSSSNTRAVAPSNKTPVEEVATAAAAPHGKRKAGVNLQKEASSAEQDSSPNKVVLAARRDREGESNIKPSRNYDKDVSTPPIAPPAGNRPANKTRSKQLFVDIQDVLPNVSSKVKNSDPVLEKTTFERYCGPEIVAFTGRVSDAPNRSTSSGSCGGGKGAGMFHLFVVVIFRIELSVLAQVDTTRATPQTCVINGDEGKKTRRVTYQYPLQVVSAFPFATAFLQFQTQIDAFVPDTRSSFWI